MELLLLLLIIIPLLTAFLIPLIDIINKKARRILVLAASLAEFFTFLFLVINNWDNIADGTIFIIYKMGGWLPPLGIVLSLDMLSFYFSLLITISVMFLILYSIGYIGHHEGKYYVLIFLMWTAMQGVVLTGDIFNFYVFVELLLITSAALIGFRRNKKGTIASIKYMFYGVIGGLFIFIGIILLYSNLGTLNYAEISANFTTLPFNTQGIISILFLIGLFIKLGIFPFHFWVARAQSTAPSPISALLSGVVEKVYIYAFLRLFWVVFDFNYIQTTGLDKIIIFTAITSSIIGHILALQESDLKRMLAYSTIGHLGIIIAVLTVNTKLAIIAGLLHVLSHLLMKISLFTTAGYLLQFVPSHQIKDSRGVAQQNMFVFAGFIIAAAGMMGLPPMLGFFSKLYIVKSFLDNSYYLSALLTIAGSITALIYYARYIIYGFRKIKLNSPQEFRLILSVLYRERLVTNIALVFAVAVLITGLIYKIFFGPLESVANILYNPSIYIDFILGG